MSELLLHGESLGLTLGGRRLFKDLSIGLHAGELLGILGPNGSGKSSLLSVLGGWLRPDSGRVLLEGRELASWAPAQRAARLTHVGQLQNPWVAFTVRELVEMGRYPHGDLGTEGQEAVAEAVRVCGLEALLDRPLGKLSGGELQRAFLARALAVRPRVLLLDEVLSAQDPRRSRDFMEHLLGCCSRGLAVVLVLHDANLASLYCRRILLLDGDGGSQEGSPEAVFTQQTSDAVFGGALKVIRDGGGGPLLIPTRREDAEGATQRPS